MLFFVNQKYFIIKFLYLAAMITAVIFDLDGLLLNSERLWRQVEKEVFQEVGIKMSDEDCRLTMGNSTKQVIEYWQDRRPWKGMSPQQMEKEIISRMTERIKEKGKPMPGVQEILEFFAAKELPMAIASSSPLSLIIEAVTKLRISTYFEFFQSAEFEKEGKPHPAIYISTANRLEIPEEKCLVFEDSIPGIKAALLANMKVVAVPDKKDLNNNLFQLADMVIPSLADFDQNMYERLSGEVPA